MKNIKKKSDYRAWNILGIMFLLIRNGTIGTTIVLLPLIIYTVKIAFNVYNGYQQAEDESDESDV